MKPRSLRKWVEIYEQKTNDKADVPKGFRLFYLPSFGYLIMKPYVKEGMMFIYSVCGDGKFWRGFAELMCRELGLNVISTICNRNIESYIKGFEGEILMVQDINGDKRYICQDNIGRKVIATIKCYRDEGEPEYWVTQYLDEKATTSEYFNLEAKCEYRI